MKKAIIAAAIGAVLCASATAVIAAPDGAGLLGQCWTPQQLTGRSEEKSAHWTRNDTPMPPATQPLPPVSATGTVRRVKLPQGRKLVALTFDLCEAAREVAGYDGAVIDYLRANQVKATFFAGGKWLLDHPERAAQLLADPRFEIGTHGWAHVNLHVATGQAVNDEILGGITAWGITRAALGEKACARDANPADMSRIPPRPKLFRFPFGTCHAEAMNAVAQAGLIAIQWDVVTGDPDRAVSAAAIARSVLDSAKPGSIIVAHANGRGWQTANALPLIIPEMRRRGYEFATVSELLAAGTPEIASSCYERRPGDNARYDMVQIRRNRAQGQAAHGGAAPTWPTVLEQR